MEKFIIAGLKTEYNIRGEVLRTRSEKYKADFDDSETQIKIDISSEYIDEKHEKVSQLSWDEHEYMWTGSGFYKELLRFGGMMLHASCVEKDGIAYLFSARSGTGKSTHTHLWLDAFENTQIVNDDKPALLREDGKWFACGTPFSGKNDESVNGKFPLRALVFLYRGQENKVKKMEKAMAAPLILEQTINPYEKTRALEMLGLIDLLIREVPIFSLHCNMEKDAAVIAYTEIERLINNED